MKLYLENTTQVIENGVTDVSFSNQLSPEDLLKVIRKLPKSVVSISFKGFPLCTLEESVLNTLFLHLARMNLQCLDLSSTFFTYHGSVLIENKLLMLSALSVFKSSSIEQLDLSSNNHLTSSELTALFKHFPNLKILNLSHNGSERFDEAQWKNLFRHAPALQSLNLCGYWGDPSAFQRMLQTVPDNIKAIHLSLEWLGGIAVAGQATQAISIQEAQDIFAYFPKHLERVHFGFNPWFCKERLSNFLTLLKVLSINVHTIDAGFSFSQNEETDLINFYNNLQSTITSIHIKQAGIKHADLLNENYSLLQINSIQDPNDAPYFERNRLAARYPAPYKKPVGDFFYSIHTLPLQIRTQIDKLLFPLTCKPTAEALSLFEKEYNRLIKKHKLGTQTQIAIRTTAVYIALHFLLLSLCAGGTFLAVATVGIVIGTAISISGIGIIAAAIAAAMVAAVLCVPTLVKYGRISAAFFTHYKTALGEQEKTALDAFSTLKKRFLNPVEESKRGGEEKNIPQETSGDAVSPYDFGNVDFSAF
ncbi:MAG: hypothetical protein WC785_10960 [Tatlockia sp.]|jgi:hypothetical protein